MKKFIKIVKKYPIFLVFVFILVYYMPQSIAKSPEGLDKMFVSTVGLDVSQGQISVSLLSYVALPSKEYTENFYVFQSEADDVLSALNKISSNVGKEVVLSYADSIVMSREFIEGGFGYALDSFYQTPFMGTDSFIFCSENKAVDILKHEQKMIQETGIKMDEIGVFNKKYIFPIDANLETFFKGYFSPTQISFLPIIEIQESEDLTNGFGKSGGEDENSKKSQQKESSNSENYFKSNDKVVVLKKGQFLLNLDEKMVEAFNLMSPKTRVNSIKLENITTETFKNATLVYSILKNTVWFNSYFNKNKPIFEMRCSFGIDLNGVVKNELSGDDVDFATKILTKEIHDKLEIEVKNKIGNFIEFLKTNRCDLLNVFKHFSMKSSKKFKNWYKNLENCEDFLNFVEFRLIPNFYVYTI